MAKRKKLLLGIMLCALLALCLSLGITCFSNAKTAYADGDSGYSKVKQGSTVIVYVTNDITIANVSSLWTSESVSSCNIVLNNHTLTITAPFTMIGGTISIAKGTVKYTKGGTFGTIYGGLYLDHVTFSGAKCDTLFKILGENREQKVKINDTKFINCEFNSNGAFYFDQKGCCEVNFINNRFYDCTNKDGSMIYINELSGYTRKSSNHAKFLMKGCVFDNCKNKSGDGGCIYINAKYVDIGDLDNEQQNVIYNCYASRYGGAIYVDDGCGYGIIKGFVCMNNKSGDDGGAFYLAADATKVDNCTFVGNSAENDEEGGAIYLEEEDYVVTDCYFCANTAYEGGAIYDEESETSFTSCYFAYDTATNGNSCEINDPRNMNDCHFYNSEKDKMFDDTWDEYFEDSDDYNNKNCTVNTYTSFLGLAGAGSDSKPFLISSQMEVYLLYVNSKYTNPLIGGNKFAITADNLIWLAQLSGFSSGSIDGRRNHLYLIGTADAITSGGNVRNYYMENRNGTYSISLSNGYGTFISGGSIIIVCVVGGVALVTAGVFMYLYFKKKKQENKDLAENKTEKEN